MAARYHVLDTTTNQNHVDVAEEGKNRMRNRWGVRGKCDSISGRAIELGEDKKQKLKTMRLLINFFFADLHY